MKKWLKLQIRQIFSTNLWTPVTIIFTNVWFFKFILFDIIWCLQTTFTPFSSAALYCNTILVTLVLALPYVLLRRRWLQIVMMLVLDGLLISNLMYSRTYNSVIPLESYLLAGNLSDFMASVVDSMRWIDLLFPISTLIAGFWVRRYAPEARLVWRRVLDYVVLIIAVGVICGLLLVPKGGFSKTIDDMQSANYYSCVTPEYTFFGSLLYDAMHTDAPCTPQIQEEVKTWFALQPNYVPLSDSISERKNLVVVLCESLESWVIGLRMEGKEITPNLNRAIADTQTLYAPNTLTQVKGGRSIDCQLLLNAGLLPLRSGCYAMKYTGNNYHTLTKAMASTYNSRSYLLTVDKPITWNQAQVAKAFGIDTLLSKDSWQLDEKVGSRKKLGDVSFMRQAVEKMKTGEIWKRGEHVYLQFVTYSGHNPFILPDNLKRIHFKGNYPQKMLDYMTMANYTDYAVGILLQYLKSRPDWHETMVVIVGDHEGLAADRADIRRSAEGRRVVSASQFTPFIVLNSPVAMRYDGILGQVDMYPTILNLMHLDDYYWRGMGQSILDKRKVAVAVGSQMNIEGDVSHASKVEINRLTQAHTIADWVIRYNMEKSLPILKKD
ncbi:MAG: LTA synthase family protein [Prevotella sp.]|nr:LTA synthase family protein [Prevotella sp.]